MTKTAIISLLRLWNRQGLLTGDLNPIQQYSLFWLMADEENENFETVKLQVLASNPEVYKSIFERKPVKEEWVDLDELEDNYEAADQLAQLAQIEQLQTGRETF